MVARSPRIEIGARSIQAQADQLDKLAGQNGMSPWIGAHPEAKLGPLRVPLTQRVQSRIPRTLRRTGDRSCVFLIFYRFVAHDFSFSLMKPGPHMQSQAASHLAKHCAL